MSIFSEVLAVFGFSQRQLHKISDRRNAAGRLIGEISSIVDELYYMVEQDHHDFAHMLEGADREALDDALEQAVEMRRQNEEHFQAVQSASSWSLRNWDNLLLHLERLLKTCIRVRDWYIENVRGPLSSDMTKNSDLDH